MGQVTRETYQNGVLVTTDTVTVPDEVSNEQTLNSRADTAIADMRALANGTGTLTAAQLTTAVRGIAKAVLYLMRLYLRRLDGTD
jgi:hypothetical protein